MILLVTRDRAFITQASAWLLAQEIRVEWLDGEAPGVWGLNIPVSDADTASESLGVMLHEELERSSQRLQLEEWVPLLWQPAFSFSLCSAILMMVFFYFVGGSGSGSPLFELGVFSRGEVLGGGWWRYITAACLHADWSHVGGNALFLMVLGWAVAERIGVGMTALMWLFTAVAGFGVSLEFSEATRTVGASGGLFGLLGAAGGHGLKKSRDAFLVSHRIREIGAACSLLAFTAFSPQANIAAHLGGFVAGVFGGLALPGKQPGALMQALAVLGTAGILVGAWYLAVGGGVISFSGLGAGL
jgi:membrane associated rhomboid family serine protease